ncbi:DUF559 domain-containing protein [Pontibacter cellulosilyticus]|uniref:DUF559 domain-containing protein n=1 Tax=Pontibacter cellulosilyticus TaxID=1720253 RepID=UPI0021D0231E|nr:DUF559 domain-containing protein [Pontibacter cellulosilyticus]
MDLDSELWLTSLSSVSPFNYFIDFANPYLRIGLELDGEQFHEPEKDKLRDQMLADFGWKIFRIKGKECYKEFKTLSDLDEEDESSKYREIQNWLCNTCDGVIKSIETIYFDDRADTPNEYYQLALRSLNNHKLANFELFD